jgi:hypothetical protein
MTILAICLLYILWSEVVTGPLNDTPEGSVINGLPYPFLKNMSFSERVSFYATTSHWPWVLCGWLDFGKVEIKVCGMINSRRRKPTG